MNDDFAKVRPSGDWMWCGYGGHFIGWRNCRFHLHTRVGDYRISTVGDYHPPSRREDKPEPLGLGADSLYETMVFRVEGHGTHGEGDFTGDGELECERYATAEEACLAHTEMCWRFDAIAKAESTGLVQPSAPLSPECIEPGDVKCLHSQVCPDCWEAPMQSGSTEGASDGR